MPKFRDKQEAVDWFVSSFNTIPQDLVLQGEWYEKWYFEGALEDWQKEEQCTEDDYGMVGCPMWGWFFDITPVIDYRWIEDNRHKLMDMGFTIVRDYDDEYEFLGIDGAGFSFKEAFWEPLYDLYGFHWHPTESN